MLHFTAYRMKIFDPTFYLKIEIFCVFKFVGVSKESKL